MRLSVAEGVGEFMHMCLNLY